MWRLSRTRTSSLTSGYAVDVILVLSPFAFPRKFIYKFISQDVGGQDKIRPLWRHYYTGSQALIFVVDSQDRERIDEARQELQRIVADREMKECLLLVFVCCE